MEGAIIFAVGMLIGMVCYYIHVRYIRGEEIVEREQQKEEKLKEQEETKEETKGESEEPQLVFRSRDLFLETLQQMNCQTHEPDDDDDERIYFTYQGGTFIAYTSNKGLMVDVIYPQWYEHDLYDIDGFSNVRRLINDLNGYVNVTVFYYIDEEKVKVHSRKQFLFSAELLRPELYLRAMLEDFFKVRQEFEVELEKINAKEELKKERS